MQQKKQYRSTEKELRYFGSDLNKFIQEECPDNMTVNNIDLIQFKRRKGIIRVIEYKNKGEHMPATQRELLEELAEVFSFLNEYYEKRKFEIYIIEGSYPYNDVTAHDLISGETIKFKGDTKEFKRFLEFKYGYKQKAVR